MVGLQQQLNTVEILHKAEFNGRGIEHFERKIYPVRLLY